MQKIEAIIKPFKLEDVKDELAEIGVTGMTVMDVKGFDRQEGRGDIDRASENILDFVPRIKIEIVVPDDVTDRVLSTIQKSAHTGKFGDGKIFVVPVSTAMRIRTGEFDKEAL